MSEDSDSEPPSTVKRKIRHLLNVSSSEDEVENFVRPMTKKIIRLEDEPMGKEFISLEDAIKDIIDVGNSAPRRRSLRPSYCGSSSSFTRNIRERRFFRAETLSDDSDSDTSDDGFVCSSSSEGGPELSDSEHVNVQNTEFDSDSSDGQSEKCPICLLSFKSQEIGVPDTCSHMFCSECILEWSKNMNTCPVDRREYSLILVRRNCQGKIIRQVPVHAPNTQDIDDIFTTFCEVCSLSDREDRLLLCDGCDLGFHLECLTPPLHQVPAGAWYCCNCSPNNDSDDSEIERLIPRTRQSERIRRRIASNRSNRTQETINEQQATSSTLPVKRKATKKKRKTTRKRYKVIHKIDKATGKTIAIKKKKRSYKKRRKVNSKTPKTVKERLALQLGIRPLRTVAQTLPEMRVQSQSTIINQRQNIGIPTLHLFGQRDELHYFSGSDEEISPGLLTRRAPNHSDILALRRTARIKEISLPNSVSSSTDVLEDILNYQTKFYSKNTVVSLGENGKFNIEIPNNFDKYLKKQPLSNDQSNNDNRPSSSNSYQSNTNWDNFMPTSTVEYSGNTENSGNYNGSIENNESQQINLSSSCDLNVENNGKKTPNRSRSNSVNSDSDLDIYSDIETVSTSNVEENETKTESPQPNLIGTDDDNDSEPDMVIDTEKAIETEENIREEPIVTSTVIDSSSLKDNGSFVVHSTTEIQSEAIQSSSQEFDEKSKDDDDNSEDGCPNFSIYSKESINLAKNTDVSLNEEKSENNQVDIISSSPATNVTNQKKSGLYSDSEDENVVKKLNVNHSFALTDLRNMTEDISEEERSYTPCLDERPTYREGLEGLDTEMISDEDRNDFDESHDLKTASDGDALEINAKESELDFTRPEDYEEGEIVDKSKLNKTDDKETKVDMQEEEKEVKTKETDDKNDKSNKENETQNKESTFKRLSKSTKERNYRDKDREESVPRKQDSNKKDRRKEKRKEIERYDVRALIAEKPRRLKDKFGRDIRRSDSRSKSRSITPTRNRQSCSRSVSKNRRSSSRSRRSVSKRRSSSRDRFRKKRGRSRQRRSLSRSKSKSNERKRSKSKTKKRKLSVSRERRSRKSTDRLKTKSTKRRASPSRSSFTPKRRKEWSRKHSKEWTPSLSRSLTPEAKHLTPSWTPPRLIENAAVKPHNLTVILSNDSMKKKKDKKKKSEKKTKENDKQKKKKKERERTTPPPPPSKEVFASGDNILVSVSFNKDNETRDVSTSKRKKDTNVAVKEVKKLKKDKRTKLKMRKQQSKDLSGIKPVAIIDLERSPFKELTPSPKDVIILTDSDNEEMAKTSTKKSVCDSSQGKSPERNNYLMGPKTPPEPQVKFTLSSKPQQLRAISNPLHEPDDLEQENEQEQVNERSDNLHKGPNTPPEPPNSPPSSPDAYDPFEPTKSRSATPDPMQITAQSNNTSNLDNNHDDSIINDNSENVEKTNTLLSTPDKSHTPPLLADVQPADSQSSIHATPESSKSPERSTINQNVQIVLTKPVNTPFSSVPTSLIISTPTSSSSNSTNSSNSRINILNSTILTPSIQQRVALPNIKSNPATKASVKLQPIKIPIKNPITRKHSNNRSNSSDNNDLINLDSPYSPGSSDYEDLFEPPTETSKTNLNKPSVSKPIVKSPAKIQNAFDALFGSPFNKNKSTKNDTNKTNNKFKKTPLVGTSKGSKQIGVKLDEDNLKILDELPNSAVEMQVKDKFLKKLNRQERVVEEVKLVLKPHYNKKHINKEEYKDILRRAVPKICHNKSGEINPTKIKNLIEAYVKKIRHSKKVTSSSSINSQKI